MKTAVFLIAFVSSLFAMPLACIAQAPDPMAKIYAEVKRQKEIAKAQIVDPLTFDEVISAAKAQGSQSTKVVFTIKIESYMLPVDEGRIGFYHPIIVTDSGADFVKIHDDHDYPLPSIFLWFDGAKHYTDYLLDCRFRGKDGQPVQMGYKTYDDTHEIHPDSLETTTNGHLTEFFRTEKDDGVTIHLRLTDLISGNLSSLAYQGCEIYELAS